MSRKGQFVKQHCLSFLVGADYNNFMSHISFPYSRFPLKSMLSKPSFYVGTH